MTKSELIDVMAEKAGLSKKDAGAALNAFTDAVTETLSKGDKLALIGFGTFSTSSRAAREGRNPSTGAAMKIAASTVAKFKAGSKLKEAVN
ncbi:MAG: HU family DNA-binding protein [Campylobacteraceae bacterium]|jgi:DNA-binding protein HU-beta|nr:HU family DNA-binding protein [Campylobacteraceae bacterium]MBT3882161.1 HU family DNA-binding protein [Campylobacteraceae bacterium]MBT4031100.1 HU family DNA-binding protein [Campylobacteraceae bacterium]MBT4179485.1 HU family DNA-binding protein [Campylobacteraceae bacterium]MBT4572020.1 HU family DNA-binding protein [Campylobacteraceae bacterium]